MIKYYKFLVSYTYWDNQKNNGRGSMIVRLNRKIITETSFRKVSTFITSYLNNELEGSTKKVEMISIESFQMLSRCN